MLELVDKAVLETVAVMAWEFESLLEYKKNVIYFNYRVVEESGLSRFVWDEEYTGSNPVYPTHWWIGRVVRWVSAKLPTQVRILYPPHLLSYGVIGNTSDFGSEESRFETL